MALPTRQPSPDPSSPPPGHEHHHHAPAVTDPTVVVAARDLFWENVVREMLTGLSMMQGVHPEMFDGRIAILTHAGERIPIGEVAPMFACSIIKADSWERAAATAVECTVFRIKTPAGELYTLPVREIRGMHAMTPELLKQIEQQAIQRITEKPDGPPFGLAAFTTVHRDNMTVEDEGEGEEETGPEGGDGSESRGTGPEPAGGGGGGESAPETVRGRARSGRGGG